MMLFSRTGNQAISGNCLSSAPMSNRSQRRKQDVRRGEAMSEYQYVAFRAIDRAVSKKDLAYMRRQSTRAEITPRSFENEHHYGDFHGNAIEMLHRGYDIHLHYANFGIRTLLVRLPDGFPNPQAMKPYFAGDSLVFRKDKKLPYGNEKTCSQRRPIAHPPEADF
jgi:hypothetical protein